MHKYTIVALISVLFVFSTNGRAAEPTVTIRLKNTQLKQPVSQFMNMVKLSKTLQDLLNDIDPTIDFKTISDDDLKTKLLINPDYPLISLTQKAYLITSKAISVAYTETETDNLCQIANTANYLDMPELLNKTLQALANNAFSKDLQSLQDYDTFRNYCVYSLHEDLQKQIIQIGLKDFIFSMQPSIMTWFDTNQEIKEVKISPNKLMCLIRSYKITHIGSIEELVEIRDVKTGNMLRIIAHDEYIPSDLLALLQSNNKMAMSRNNELISIGTHNEVKLWNAHTLQLIAEKKLDGIVSGVTFSSDTNYLAVSYNNTASLFALQQLGEKDAVFTVNTNEPIAIAASINPYSMLVGTRNDGYLWNVGNTNPIITVNHNHHPIIAVALSTNGKILFTGGPGELRKTGQFEVHTNQWGMTEFYEKQFNTGIVKMWLMDTKQIKTIVFDDPVTNFCLSNDEKYLMVAAGNKVYLYQVTTDTSSFPLINTIRFERPVLSVDISADNLSMIVASGNTAYILDFSHRNIIDKLSIAEAQLWFWLQQKKLIPGQLPQHWQAIHRSLIEK